jgi:hypothetical protein
MSFSKIMHLRQELDVAAQQVHNGNMVLGSTTKEV